MEVIDRFHTQKILLHNKLVNLQGFLTFSLIYEWFQVYFEWYYETLVLHDLDQQSQQQ
jgi:hypothetical protein